MIFWQHYEICIIYLKFSIHLAHFGSKILKRFARSDVKDKINKYRPETGALKTKQNDSQLIDFGAVIGKQTNTQTNRYC